MEKIEMAMEVGDLAMKAAPESIGLAWASIRLCMRAVEDDFATFSLFSSAGNDIIGILISCGVYGQMYGGERGPPSFYELHSRVVDYIPDIYCSILEFSYEMKKHMNRCTFERVGRGVFASSASKFQGLIQAVRNGEAKMRGCAGDATQQLSIYYHEQGLENQGAMLGLLTGIEETMRSYMKLGEVFAERVRQLEEERKTLRKKTPLDIATEIFEENRKSLNPTNDQRGAFKEKLDRRGPNTCMWIFYNEKFKDWKESAENNLLWISGGGGYGKSILMSSIIKQLEDDLTIEDGSIVHYFFCNAGDEATQKTRRILHHLLYDLYARTKDSLEMLEEANKVVSSFFKNKKPGGPTAEGSKDAITFEGAYAGLTKILKKNVYLIVDALDECNDREPQSLLKTIRNTAKSDGVKIKIALCSRAGPPETDIITSLDGVPQIKVEDSNGPDIQQNARSELNKLPGWTNAERELAEKEIVTKAGSFFRYVELAIKFLRQPWQRPLENRLKELPKGLDNSYQQLLQQIDPNYVGLLRTCLTWTILAAREPTVDEAVDAYSRAYDVPDIAGEEASSLDLLEGTDSKMYIDQIRVAGSSFIEVDVESKIISLRHNTVSDYFLNKQEKDIQVSNEQSVLCGMCASKNTKQPFTISKKTGHLEIATTLIGHLNSPVFQKRFFHDQKDDIENAGLPADADTDSSATLRAMEGLKQDSDVLTHNEAVLMSNDTALVTSSDTSRQLPNGTSATTLPLKGTESSVEDGTCENENVEPSAVPLGSNDVVDESIHSPDDDSDADSDIVFDAEVEYTGVYTSLDAEENVRYEISHWSHHLRLAEKLWPIKERRGPEWATLWNILDSFFDNGSPAFRSWISAKCSSNDPWPFYNMKPKEIRPIHVATAYGLVSLTARILEREPKEVSAMVGDGRQPIHFAADWWTEDVEDKDAKLELLQILLEKGADANAKSEDRGVPAHSLIWNPDIRHVEMLLKHGARFHDASTTRMSPLHLAAAYVDDIEVFKAIVGSVPDINVKDSQGETPLHKLLSQKEFPIEKLNILIDKGADVHIDDDESQQPLYEIAAAGNLAGLSIVLDAGADVHDDDINGATALHAAARSGHKEITRVLIEKGAQVSQTDHEGRTPFFFACQSGNAETAMYLLEESQAQGYKVSNQRSKSGKTPLKKAAARGLMETVRMLLKDDTIASTINDQDAKLQRTPLHSAAYNGHKDMVALLLEHGARVDLVDKNGNTPLELCAQGWLASTSDKHEATLLVLVDRQPEDAAKGVQLLNASAAKGSLPMINKLLDLNADPNERDEHGWTATQLARQYGHFEAAELLKRRNVVTGKKPTEWARTVSKYARVLHNGIGVEHDSIAKDNKNYQHVSFLSDHPIPAGVDKFYYEVTIEHVPDKKPNPWIGIGVAHKFSTQNKWMIGFKNDASPGAASWAYHGDDGRFFHWPEDGQIRNASVGKSGLGDTIGCAIDCKDGRIFYTRNGERLMDKVFEKVAGRLHLGIGLADEARVSTNFGSDVNNKPFRWAPGNTLDFNADWPPVRPKRFGERTLSFAA